MGPHVDRAVRGQLGGVDDDPAAGLVDELGEHVDGWHDARHVRGPADGEDGDATPVAGELGAEVVEVERAVGGGADVDDLGPSPPRQVVGVVLEDRREDDRAGRDRDRRGEPVDRLGRVPGEDHDVPSRVGTDEVAHDLAGPFVRRRAEPRAVAGAPVHAAGGREEPGHGVGDGCNAGVLAALSRLTWRTRSPPSTVTTSSIPITWSRQATAVGQPARGRRGDIGRSSVGAASRALTDDRRGRPRRRPAGRRRRSATSSTRPARTPRAAGGP